MTVSRGRSNNSSSHPQHLGGYSFDCCTERYEIVVYCFDQYVDTSADYKSQIKNQSKQNVG